MRKAGKNVEKARKAVEPRPYTLQDAVPLLQKVKFAKFDETVEVTLRLGVDPKHADQMVRGTVVLPHGLGKSKKVLVIASGDKVREAQGAGADFVGGEDMVEKITKENWTDFDALIATPDMMKSVGRLGKVLGPKGLMPNPKTGTVTMDVARAVQEVKAGKVEFRTDKTALVHVPVGKISFPPEKLVENATHADHKCDQGEAVGGEREVHQGMLSEFDDGAWDRVGHDRDRDSVEGIDVWLGHSCPSIRGERLRTRLQVGQIPSHTRGIEDRTWRLLEQRKLSRLKSWARTCRTYRRHCHHLQQADGGAGLRTAQSCCELRREVPVVKNTLAELAAKGTKVEGALKDLAGVTSIAYTEGDPVALAKALAKYAKDNPEFTFKTGLSRAAWSRSRRSRRWRPCRRRKRFTRSCCS